MTTARDDPRRLIPRTDAVLADPRLQAAAVRLGSDAVKRATTEAQQRARIGEISPGDVADAGGGALPKSLSSTRPVLNAPGVVLHTNLGRASLSDNALDALTEAAAYTDVEYDLATGQ